MQPKRIIISLLVVILALFSAGITVSAEDSSTLDMAVEVSSSTALSDKLCAVELGDIVTVSVTIKSNPGISFATFTLEYDSDKIRPTVNTDSTLRVEHGTAFTDASATAVLKDDKIIYTLENDENIYTTGTVFSLNFVVLEHGTAEIVLNMDEEDAVGIAEDGMWETVSGVTIAYGDDASATAAYVLVHDFGDPTTVPPTCTEGGKDVYTCSTCNQLFRVSNGTPAKNHTETVIPSVPVSCVQDGMTEGLKCSVCNTVLRAPVVAVEKSDAYHVAVIDAPVTATCTATGLTSGSHCSACNKVLTEQTVVPMLEHKYGDWVIVTEATESADGTRKKTCTLCNDAITETYKYSGSADTDPAGTQPADQNSGGCGSVVSATVAFAALALIAPATVLCMKKRDEE